MEKDGVLFLVEKSILARAGTITVDFEDGGSAGPGFAIIAEARWRGAAEGKAGRFGDGQIVGAVHAWLLN